MTKKTFIALADALREHNRTLGTDDVAFDGSHLDALADFCAAQNPRFNRERWLGYIAGECGPNGGKA
jgi:hypothetical protein